jgi:ribonuclease Z
MINGQRVIDGPTETPRGLPLPVTGRALTSDPVVVKDEGAELRQYPEIFRPGEEELGADEIRLTCCGSGNPIVRRAQAATSWLVELGNGERFVFDVGGGAVQNLWSLGISPAELDKVFLTHLHLDHVGDLHVIYDAMGWARNTPLHVWGPSGYTEEMGTAAFCEHMWKAALWHNESKSGHVPSSGAVIESHEFDYSQFGPDNPQLLVYEENGVTISAFPTVHCIYGAVGYRLDWNGLSISFHGDGTPCSFEAEQVKGVDVMMHEAFLDAETFSRKAGIPLETTESIVALHTTGERFGELCQIAEPTLAVAYHYFLDDDTVDPFFELLRSTYDGPVVLAQDLTVINVTPEQIVNRLAETDLLHWPPPPPADKRGGEMAGLSEAEIPAWLQETVLASVGS